MANNKNSNTSGSSSSSSEDEETRRFRVQCAAVATASSAPPRVVQYRVQRASETSLSSREKMMGSDTIAKALEDKVGGTLVFVVPDLGTSPPTSSKGREQEQQEGMQLFRRGPNISKPLPVRQDGILSGLSCSSIKKKKKKKKRCWLPARRMIDHQTLFSTKGCIDKRVVVQGDALLQKKLHHGHTPMNTKHKGIVVETIRSKARLRRLKEETQHAVFLNSL